MAKLETLIAATAAWRDELHAAEVEAEAAATAVAPAPSKATVLANRRMLARERAVVARDGLEAAHTVEMAARRAEAARIADSMTAAIDEARAAVDQHAAEVAALIAPLAELTGHRSWSPTVRVVSADRGERWRVDDATPAEAALTGALRDLLAHRDALLAAAAGETPAGPADQLPPELQPGGLLPDPRLVEARAEQAARDAAEERWSVVLAGKQEQLNAACRTLGIDPPEVPRLESDFQFGEVNAGRWREYADDATDLVLPTEWDVLARLLGPHHTDRLLDAWLASR